MVAPQNIWNDLPALVRYYTDNDIPMRPQPGFLVLSIIVSILGSYATLLLLGRRTSNKGLRNFGFLVISAICFAAVAVWGMHFVSMISVRLDPSPNLSWAIMFSPGMTTLSLFVPLLATICAFWFLGDDPSYVADKDDSWKAALSPRNLLESWRILAGGIFLGLTIGLMHYSASFQLPNFNVSYTAVTVVFALILACVAATAALALFFRARQQWQESFWKRIVCSLFLAAAVCGMHYLGLGGTSYRTREDVSPDSLASNGQNTRLIIAISVMCGAIILISIFLAIADFRTRVQMKAKAKNIVLASVAFDDNGKILVKPDGTIPMQIMQTDTDSRNLTDLLDPRLSSFQWLYQMSFCWRTAVVPHVPRILNTKATGKGTFADPALVATAAGKEAFEKVSFRSRFIEAAVLLAHSLDLSIESIGTLFDRVLTTGTKEFDKQELAEKFMPQPNDDESSIHGITMKLGSSEGVMCFLARELGNGKHAAADLGVDYDPTKEIDTVDYYLDRGWRLAETRFFSKLLADYMGVSKAEMDVFLNACKTYAKRGSLPVVQEGGVYLGLFGVRPTGSSDGGLDVLVYNFARHQIPAYRLPDISTPLNGKTLTWLRSCTNISMHDLLDKCNEALNEADSSSRGSNRDSEELDELEVFYDFLAALCVSLESLTTAMRVWPTLTHQARLSPDIIELPASDSDDKRPAQMLLLSMILPAPESKLTPVQTRASGIQVPHLESTRRDWDKPPAPFVYSPWNLFCRSQTMILRGGVYRDIAKNLNTEIGKMYMRPANDLAAEIAAADKRNKGPDAANPFIDSAAAKGRGRHARRPSTADALDEKVPPSVPGDSTINLTSSPHTPGKKRRPGTGTEHGLKGALSSLVGGKKEGVLSEAELTDFAPPASQGIPEYASVRNKADLWFVRMMQALAEADAKENKYLEYTDWESQCKLLPLN